MRKAQSQCCQKQVPGHRIRMAVGFLPFKGKQGEDLRRFHTTAMGNATRVRALKIYEKHIQAMR